LPHLLDNEVLDFSVNQILVSGNADVEFEVRRRLHKIDNHVSAS